ncbi:MAG TPA: class I SAM-dependent RNA methyltransferase [Dehalococcoidia bacterium]|nr:class I SAM-dependent RNA methyltransferase [Dehalococcoidia bacterium]
MTASPQVVALNPQAMSYRGTAVARLNGQAVFISGALPGESIIAEIERRRRDFLEARAVEVVEASPQRVQPRCDHFGESGSCEWEFIAYPEQLRLKSEILSDQLRRVGRFAEPPVLPAVPSPSEWGYRNHVRFAVDADGRPSYLRRASHIPVAVDACAVICPQLDALLPRLQNRLSGLESVVMRFGVNTSELLIAPSLEGRGVDLASGQQCYHEELLGRRFQVSAGSFFQVNTSAADELARLLLEAVALSGSERVADLYAGVGTFACLMAPRAGAVFAVEAASDALEDGRINSGFLENVRYRKGLVEQVLPRLDPPPEVAVLDPPRSGCERRVIGALIERPPRRIVYCSCDTATLARDLRLLVDSGYHLRSSRVIDMFPQTPHIESLSVLER